ETASNVEAEETGGDRTPIAANPATETTATPVIAETAQPDNSVNSDIISRLENLTQTLKQREADAEISGGNP
ncbi:hypothetical protein, partial [Phormidium sp. CCY1219]|uniref:hypothetical protein n=1 Tax=Phormidium sp. CCY1219 TaxID=2886104 RepID=UPI002D1F220B